MRRNKGFCCFVCHIPEAFFGKMGYINYDAEVMPGDVVKISRIRQETEEGIVYYITGKVSDKQNFSVKLLF